MTYREYLQECDEFDKAVIIVNFARNHPNYEALSPKSKHKMLNNFLDSPVPWTQEDKSK